MASTDSATRGLRRAGQYAAYALFRAVEWLLGLLPLEWVHQVGSAAGAAAHALAWKYRKLAANNARIAFGRELSEDQIRVLVRAHFRSLGANLLCGFKLPLMTEEEVCARVKTEGMEQVRDLVAEGKPLLYCLCHLSCWELLTQIPSLVGFGKRPSSIYQPLSNPYLNAHVLRRREKLGYALFDRTLGFAAPIKHLRSEGGVVGVLVDQHAGDKGVWCPFFNRLASTTSLPALMSLRTGAPLVPLALYDDGPARWRMVGYPPVESGEARPTAEGLTAALNLAVEKMIRRAPSNWFWVHNRWKTPKPDFLLSEYRRGVTLPQGFDPAGLQPFQLLVRSPNWLGDACMAFPAVRALKAGRPDLRLTILAPAKLRDLWSSLPEVDAVICKDKEDGLLDVARKVRGSGARFEAAVLLTNSIRSALELKFAGIPRLAGYRGSLRSWLLGQVAPEPRKGRPPEHHARRYLRLARHAGAGTDAKELFAVGQPLPAADGVTRVGVCAGAEYGPAKRWPLEKFAATLNAIAKARPDIEWVLVGAPGEVALGERLSMMLVARHVNLVGKTELADLIAMLRQMRVLLTNDTGTMHLAAALGVPTVAIFGSTEPTLTGPLGRNHSVIRNHVACSPCFRRECPFGHYECMRGIDAAEVGRAVVAHV